MVMERMRASLGVVAGLLVCASTAAAETVTYTGSGSIRSNDSVMPLNNGDSVITSTGSGVAAISTIPPSVMQVRCTGMGVMKSDSDFGMVSYCAMVDVTDSSHGVDLKGIESPDGLAVEIVGGSGKWKGATGTGSVQSVSMGQDSSTFTFEIEVNTP